MKKGRHFWRCLTKFFLEWEMFYTKVVEKIKTHILFSVTFFRKLHYLWDNAGKCSGGRAATNDVTIWRIHVACWITKTTCTYSHAHAHAPGNAHTCTHASTCIPVINAYRFSTATMVSWTRLIVTLYLHCLSCSYCNILQKCFLERN